MPDFKPIGSGITPSFSGQKELKNKSGKRTIGGAIKERYESDQSPVSDILTTLAIPGQAIASMARERQEREDDPYRTPIPYGQAALRGVANPRTSFADVPGVGKGEGLIADIVIDPLWVVPSNAPLKAIRVLQKPAARVTESALRSKTIDHVVGRVMSKFKKNWEIERAGFKGYGEAVEDAANRVENRVMYDLVGEGKVYSEIRKLVPDPERAKYVGELVELRTDPRVAKEIAALPDAERKAFDIAVDAVNAITDMRLKFTELTPDVVKKFEAKTGFSYMPRKVAPRDAILEDLDDAWERFGHGWDEKGQELFQGVRDAIAKGDEFPSESYVRELARVYDTATDKSLTSFLKERKITDSVRALGKSGEVHDAIAYAILEKDMARALHLGSIDTARAAYRSRYIKAWKDYAVPRKALIHGDDLPHVPPYLRGKGPTELVPVKGVDELEGYYAPRALVEDLHEKILAPLDPQKAQNAVGLMPRINWWLKAWMLAPLDTQLRNAVDSVVWRNAAAGMGPKEGKFFGMMGGLMKSQKNGVLDDSVEYLAGKTQKEIFDELVDGGIWGVNSVSEVMDFGKRLDPRAGLAKWFGRGWFSRMMDPRTSPVLDILLTSRTAIENYSRGTMYLWRRSLGDTPEMAAKFVNKWHIDYRHGLTRFEQGLRDRWMPFYAFSRFNWPLVLETLVTRGKLLVGAGHAKAAYEDIFGNPEQDFNMAGFFAEGVPLTRYNKETDTYQVMMLDGWWSFADLNKLVPKKFIESLVGLLSPTVTKPIEVLTNLKLYPKPFQARKLSGPGDKFKLLGMEAEFPLDKRVESVIRLFRPLDEADKILAATNQKYGTTFKTRFSNAMAETLGGKVYETTREKQLRTLAWTTGEALREIQRAMRRAEEEGDSDTYMALSRQAEELRQLRKTYEVEEDKKASGKDWGR